MAKKTNHSPGMLFAVSAALLAGGWLMKSFPVLIFAAYAPLLAITDRANEKNTPWNHLELILVALFISLVCARFFDFSLIILLLSQAIGFALLFAGYHFACHNLAPRLGKFTIIFFWLALEYLLLKLPWRAEMVFLADAVQIQSGWWRWSYHTGYLGISLWILTANLIFYLALFKSGRVNIPIFIIALLFVGLPILYSYFYMNSPGINRAQMIALYSSVDLTPGNYYNRGEWITRTAAWVSVLILLLAMVRNKIRKK
jgi:apolipoprotein N-acyltransferase